MEKRIYACVSYELSNKLVNFPDIKHGRLGNARLGLKGELIPDRQYPIMSEVLEAIGGNFASLTYIGNQFIARGKGKIAKDKIPEHALAKLWLALNKREGR